MLMWLTRASIKTTIVKHHIRSIQAPENTPCGLEIRLVKSIRLWREFPGMENEMRAIDAELVELEYMSVGAMKNEVFFDCFEEWVALGFWLFVF
jgi:hypothetical protein